MLWQKRIILLTEKRKHLPRCHFFQKKKTITTIGKVSHRLKYSSNEYFEHCFDTKHEIELFFETRLLVLHFKDRRIKDMASVRHCENQ